MSGHLLVLNTVLALLDPRRAFHEAAHRWVEFTPDIRFLTCPLVQNGVIRVASQSTDPNALGTAADVRAVLTDFCADPRHEFCPDDISLLDPVHLSQPVRLTPSRVTDVYLIALARHHGARLATFDRRIPADAVPDGSLHISLLET